MAHHSGKVVRQHSRQTGFNIRPGVLQTADVRTKGNDVRTGEHGLEEGIRQVQGTRLSSSTGRIFRRRVAFQGTY